MQTPDASELRDSPLFQLARKHWAVNAVFAWLSAMGFIATVVWAGLALFGGRTWPPAVGLLAGALFMAYVAREYRRAAARQIGDQIGLEGIPLEMEQWGNLRVAAAAMKRADAWHAERYGGKTEAELAALAREDEQIRRELEEFDREREQR